MFVSGDDLRMCLCAWRGPPRRDSYHGLLVCLLNHVTKNFTVSIVLGGLPFERHVKTPHIHNLQGFGGSWEIYPKQKCNPLIQMTCTRPASVLQPLLQCPSVSSPLASVFLTHNLYIDGGCVCHVFNLHVEVIFPRVFPL